MFRTKCHFYRNEKRRSACNEKPQTVRTLTVQYVHPIIVRTQSDKKRRMFFFFVCTHHFTLGSDDNRRFLSRSKFKLQFSNATFKGYATDFPRRLLTKSKDQFTRQIFLPAKGVGLRVGISFFAHSQITGNRFYVN